MFYKIPCKINKNLNGDSYDLYVRVHSRTLVCAVVIIIIIILVSQVS